MKNIGYRDLELIDELERITGINPCSIDFDDPEVMKIFQVKQDSELMMDCCNIPGFDYAYINKILKVANPNTGSGEQAMRYFCGNSLHQLEVLLKL